MSNIIPFPVIAGVEITTDTDGRFSLNALHRASGSIRFKQVKAIPWLLEVFAPSKGMYQQMGKLLGKISAELNYEVLKIECSEYGQVKAYHVDVILEAKCRIDCSDELMGKYRNSKVGEVA